MEAVPREPAFHPPEHLRIGKNAVQKAYLTMARDAMTRVIVIGVMLLTVLPATFAQLTPGVRPKPFSAGSSFMSSVGYQRRAAADLAPTGRLRVALNMGQAALVTKDPATGEVRGVAVELGRELAGALGVPFAPVEYPGLPAIVATVNAKAWDVAFLAITPERARDMDLSTAYTHVDATYLVPAGSRIKTVPDADQPGVRIAIQSRGAVDQHLTGALKQARLVRTETLPAAFDLLRTGQADAMASERQVLVQYAERLPGAQVLADRFLTVRQGIGLPKGHPVGLGYVRTFVEQAKASGLVKRAIDHAGLRGAEVAPPAPPTSMQVR